MNKSIWAKKIKRVQEEYARVRLILIGLESKLAFFWKKELNKGKSVKFRR